MSLVGLEVCVEMPWGGTSFSVPLEDFGKYVENPSKYEAELIGMTESCHRDYVEQKGAVRCYGKTRHGNRCKNHVTPPDRNPDQWKLMNDSFPLCHCHGKAK
jgi:putative hemolysin